jgi:outer membrane protein assembly factor BamB
MAAAGIATIAGLTGTAVAQPAPAAVSGWPQFQGNASHTGAEPGERSITPANVRQLSLAWTATLPAPYDQTEAAVSGGVVYAVAGGTLTALDATTGAQLWQQTVVGDVLATPTVADGLVLVTSLRKTKFNFIYAFNATTGALAWRKTSTGVTFSQNQYNESVTVAGTTGYVVEGDTVVAFGVKRGKQLWTSPALAGCHTSALSVADGYVVIGSGGSSVTALHASDGAVAWQQTFSTGCETGGATWTPAISGGTVYAGLHTGLVSLSLTTGTVGFHYTGARNIYFPMALVDGQVVFGESAGTRLSAVSEASGQPTWTDTSGGTLVGPVTSFGHLIWVTNSTGTTSEVTAYSPATGRMLYRSDYPSGDDMPPVVDAGHVYVIVATSQATEVICLSLPGAG